MNISWKEQIQHQFLNDTIDGHLHLMSVDRNMSKNYYSNLDYNCDNCAFN